MLLLELQQARNELPTWHDVYHSGKRTDITHIRSDLTDEGNLLNEPMTQLINLIM